MDPTQKQINSTADRNLSMLYFAYGSNMDPKQMKDRCPDAKVFGLGYLADHAICFPRRSLRRACGVSSVEPKVGQNTWGVVYEIGPRDIEALDKSEGYRSDRDRRQNAYNRVVVIVNIEEEPVSVETYVAEPQEGTHLPNELYMSHILDGARHHGLPGDYLALLANIARV